MGRNISISNVANVDNSGLKTKKVIITGEVTTSEGGSSPFTPILSSSISTQGMPSLTLPTLTTSSFQTLRSESHGGSQWQMSNDSIFENILISESTAGTLLSNNMDTLYTSPSSWSDANLYFRARHISSAGSASEWSNVIQHSIKFELSNNFLYNWLLKFFKSLGYAFEVSSTTYNFKNFTQNNIILASSILNSINKTAVDGSLASFSVNMESPQIWTTDSAFDGDFNFSITYKSTTYTGQISSSTSSINENYFLSQIVADAITNVSDSGYLYLNDIFEYIENQGFSISIVSNSNFDTDFLTSRFGSAKSTSDYISTLKFDFQSFDNLLFTSSTSGNILIAPGNYHYYVVGDGNSATTAQYAGDQYLTGDHGGRGGQIVFGAITLGESTYINTSFSSTNTLNIYETGLSNSPTVITATGGGGSLGGQGQSGTWGDGYSSGSSGASNNYGNGGVGGSQSNNGSGQDGTGFGSGAGGGPRGTPNGSYPGGGGGAGFGVSGMTSTRTGCVLIKKVL